MGRPIEPKAPAASPLVATVSGFDSPEYALRAGLEAAVDRLRHQVESRGGKVAKIVYLGDWTAEITYTEPGPERY
jgi:hypothetical protein